jgi:hypothetical protein
MKKYALVAQQASIFLLVHLHVKTVLLVIYPLL